MAISLGPEARLEIALDSTLDAPLYRQLFERVRAAILSGQLPAGVRLPSSRALAAELGISRSTVVLAYELLTSEGYLTSQVGHGTRVAGHLAAPPPATPAPGGETATLSSRPNPRLAARLAALEGIPKGLVGGVQAVPPFLGGQPALDLFPYDLWARLLARNARDALAGRSSYQEAAGIRPLREAIAAHIAVSRGVRCAPEQIIVTAGTQGALDLVARVLLDPGDAVWLENPGYFGVFRALALASARLIPVPVDAEGLDVEAGCRLCPDARLVAATPSHQFPTGVTMSLRRRIALLDWARRADAWILEDDYDSEFRFTGRPLEALQGLDRDRRVLYLGSFSKTLFPALRLGYVVAPPELVEPLLTARRAIDAHPPVLEQLALADFIREGHFARHLRRMRQHYQRRRDCLVGELRDRLGSLLELDVPEAGMQLVGWLPPGVDDRRAADLAAQAGLVVLPLSGCALAPLPRGGFVFGFAAFDEATIRRGVQDLAEALRVL